MHSGVHSALSTPVRNFRGEVRGVLHVVNKIGGGGGTGGCLGGGRSSNTAGSNGAASEAFSKLDERILDNLSAMVNQQRQQKIQDSLINWEGRF